MQSPGRHWSRHRSSLPWQKWLLEGSLASHLQMSTCPHVKSITWFKLYNIYMIYIYINDRYSSLFMHTIQYAWIHCTYKTLSCIHVNDSWPPWSPWSPYLPRNHIFWWQINLWLLCRIRVLQIGATNVRHSTSIFICQWCIFLLKSPKPLRQ